MDMGRINIGLKPVPSLTAILFLNGQNNWKKTIKVAMHCTVVYGKIVGVPLNILSSVFIFSFIESMCTKY